MTPSSAAAHLCLSWHVCCRRHSQAQARPFRAPPFALACTPAPPARASAPPLASTPPYRCGRDATGESTGCARVGSCPCHARGCVRVSRSAASRWGRWRRRRAGGSDCGRACRAGPGSESGSCRDGRAGGENASDLVGLSLGAASDCDCLELWGDCAPSCHPSCQFWPASDFSLADQSWLWTGCDHAACLSCRLDGCRDDHPCGRFELGSDSAPCGLPSCRGFWTGCGLVLSTGCGHFGEAWERQSGRPVVGGRRLFRDPEGYETLARGSYSSASRLCAGFP